MIDKQLQNMFIVLENGKPAVLKNSKVWNCCVFRSADGATDYAEYWCDKLLEGRDITVNDWFEGVDISQTEDKTIISVSSILIPMYEGTELHYPPGVRGHREKSLSKRLLT